MNLSTQEFAKIVRELSGDEPRMAFPGKNNRRSARVELKHRATIIPQVDGVPGEGEGVEVRDFSPRGIRFLYSARLPRGDQFVLALPQHTGDPVEILCTVVHCRVTAEGPFSIGAEFTCALRKPQAPRPPSRDGRTERERIRQSILD